MSFVAEDSGMPDEILTIEEVAKYLKVSERTVYDWAQRGMIPAGKLGTSWRFKRSEVERWVDERLSGGGARSEPRPFSLAHLLKPERVMVLDVATKVDALNAMIDNLAEAPQVKDRGELAEAVYRREALMSTGIGMGVAVPHVRLASVSDLVMTAALDLQPIEDYESLDGLPVRLLFLIAARRDQHAQHIKTLAAISGLIKAPGHLEQLLACRDADGLFGLLTGREDGGS